MEYQTEKTLKMYGYISMTTKCFVSILVHKIIPVANQF